MALGGKCLVEWSHRVLGRSDPARLPPQRVDGPANRDPIVFRLLGKYVYDRGGGVRREHRLACAVAI
jgi:hypothetical protein